MRKKKREDGGDPPSTTNTHVRLRDRYMYVYMLHAQICIYTHDLIVCCTFDKSANTSQQQTAKRANSSNSYCCRRGQEGRSKSTVLTSCQMHLPIPDPQPAVVCVCARCLFLRQHHQSCHGCHLPTPATISETISISISMPPCQSM